MMHFARAEIMRNARFAGNTLRYHAWPTIQRQTNADHTWNVMRIYELLFGLLPPEVSSHLIWHDAGELASGDLPFPVKSQNPDLKEACDRIERNQIARMGGVVQELPPFLKLRSKLADLCEMAEFGIVEMRLGNGYAAPIWRDCSSHALGLAVHLPDDDFHAVKGFLKQLGEPLYKGD
jgi:hypothetical protein